MSFPHAPQAGEHVDPRELWREYQQACVTIMLHQPIRNEYGHLRCATCLWQAAQNADTERGELERFHAHRLQQAIRALRKELT